MTNNSECNQKIAEQVFDELLPQFQKHEIYTKGEIFEILNSWVLEYHLIKIGVVQKK